ncbi:MAG: hypothetical protein LBE92_17580 [Chryseobacterium sp.]|jgi:hypothetical protein|uniref:hypothetical protein n=1 Tax=Chryseobacterium sp. TaxID=1871047 RepID=UPI002821FE4E|nr:hypothetical protein [Chryseobacterium sp.]MDR2237939.1 hypothetical protein [Chryseobacterium sp.]
MILWNDYLLIFLFSKYFYDQICFCRINLYICGNKKTQIILKGDQTLFRKTVLKSIAILLTISVFGNYSPKFCSDREWDAEKQSFFFKVYHAENMSDISEEEIWFHTIGKPAITPELKNNIMPAHDNSIRTAYYAANEPISFCLPFGDHDALSYDTHQQIDSDGGNGPFLPYQFRDWNLSLTITGSGLNDGVVPEIFDGS